VTLADVLEIQHVKTGSDGKQYALVSLVDALWPNEVARLYGVPPHSTGRGQCVGVLALAGGYLPGDVEKACAAMGVRTPELVDVPAGCPVRSIGSDPTFDKELALDIQVLAGLLPEARLVVYFAQNATATFAQALDAVLNDPAHRPGVLSISWGAAEEFWAEVDRRAAQEKLAAATRANITVVAASGDGLANGGFPGAPPSVWFPGSSPDVLCCGGTTITLSPDGQRIDSEVVWCDGYVGTGGGISHLFAVPEFQRDISLPKEAAGGSPGRGVPDVAAAAGTAPGYRVVLDGQEVTAYGTSAATPLWAGLVALANAERGRALASVNNYLYAHRELFTTVLKGNNFAANGVGYEAQPVWSACTGLGAPIADKLIPTLALMVQDGH
jgi:kumamolisin